MSKDEGLQITMEDFCSSPPEKQLRILFKNMITQGEDIRWMKKEMMKKAKFNKVYLMIGGASGTLLFWIGTKLPFLSGILK